MKVHELKLNTKYFDDVKDGTKTFEIRKNDRGYQVGDLLSLSRFKDGNYDHYDRYYVRQHNKVDIREADTILMQVVYITDYEQKDDYIVIGIRPYKGAE